MLNTLPINSQTLGWQGHLELDFGYHDGATLLQRSSVKAPQKVQRPFYPEGRRVCHGVMLHTAGGIVGGDRLFTKVSLQPQSQVLLTTATAGKIYRSNGLEAHQTTQLSIAEGACLEWLPQETIVFNSAQYRQNLRIDLAKDALWAGWELTRLGRSARGEQFIAGVWRSHTEVWQQDRLIWVDPQWIAGDSEVMNSPHGLAKCSVVASFAIMGQEVSAELVEAGRDLWRATENSSAHSSEITLLPSEKAASIGITRLPLGIVCRYRGNSTSEARRWFVAVWDLMRREYLQRPCCKPRVW